MNPTPESLPLDETDRKRQDFEELARPLVKWLNENYHPHVVVHIEPTGAQLYEGIIGVPVMDFIKD